jgi:hypothetical protein
MKKKDAQSAIYDLVIELEWKKRISALGADSLFSLWPSIFF